MITPTEGKIENRKYNLKREESFVSQVAEANKELEDENAARSKQDELDFAENIAVGGDMSGRGRSKVRKDRVLDEPAWS